MGYEPFQLLPDGVDTEFEEMRIDYCPKCHKAGLKYHSNWDDPKYYAYHFEKDGAGNTHCVDEIQKICPPEGYGTAKWCPRCKEWVKPENHEWSRSK